MTYSEKDLEEYNDYMNYIRECIKDDCLTKFKLKVEDKHIEIGNIKPDKDKWMFYYEVKRKTFSRYCMTKQISFEEWKLLLVKENRDKRINELLEGLDKPEKNKLGI